MSHELLALITLGVFLGLGQIGAVIYAIKGFREMHRVQRALGGLVVQESERVQALMKGYFSGTR
jgi:hypothetical protein